MCDICGITYVCDILSVHYLCGACNVRYACAMVMSVCDMCDSATSCVV